MRRLGWRCSKHVGDNVRGSLLHGASGYVAAFILTKELLTRAFASGCTAMTGVEAVSNGVGASKEPVVREAHRTLTVICVTLGLFRLGIGFVARFYGLGAMNQTQTGDQVFFPSSRGRSLGAA